MPIILNKQRLRNGLYGRYFNNYFSDNMSNLANSTNSDVRTQLNSYSVGTTDTWLFRGYFLADTTSTTWRFRTTSDDASYVWIGSNARASDTSLNTEDAVVDNGGIHSSRTRSSGAISLTGGVFYPIAIVVGNNTGPGSLTLSWSAGSIYSSDGDGYFFRNPKALNGYNL